MTIALAERLSDIRPFYVMELLKRAHALQQGGADIVHMEIGEPDFPSPPAVVEAGMRALAGGDIKYTPAAGLAALREAIAAHYAKRYRVAVDADRIFITPGASGALMLALACAVNPGDRVLLADPGYPCYSNFIRLFDGLPQAVAVGAESNFQLDRMRLAADWLPDTAGVIVASPSNPTGTQIDDGAFDDMLSFVAERGGFFVSDEIYHGLEYGRPARSALEFSDRAFVINSFSKYFGMTGWRLGWLVAPATHVDAVERLAQNIFISAPSHSQYAALAAFGEANLQELERRRQEFRTRRDYLCDALTDIGFGIPASPDGAFYVYADCSRFCDDSFAFAWDLLERAHVAVTPGRDFGGNQPERFLRFSYTTSLPRIQLGLQRLRRHIDASAG